VPVNRCTGGAPSSEPDGGFAPINSPMNTIAGEGEILLNYCLHMCMVSLTCLSSVYVAS